MSEYRQIWHTNTSRYSLQLLCFGQSLNPTLRCSFLMLKFLARKPLPGTRSCTQPCTQLVYQTTRNELSDPRYTTRYTTVYQIHDRIHRLCTRTPEKSSLILGTRLDTRPCTQLVYLVRKFSKLRGEIHDQVHARVLKLCTFPCFVQHEFLSD